MRFRRTLLLGLLLAPALGLSQGQITVQVPDRQRYRVWVATEFPPLPYTAYEGRGPDLPLDAPPPVAGEQVYVWNLDTGNLAIRDRSLVASVWTVLPEDFTRVAVVFVRMPDAEGIATAKVGSVSQECRLQPKDEGVCRFYGLPIGTVTLEFAGPGGKPVGNAFDLPRERSEPEPRWMLSSARTATSDALAWVFTLVMAGLFSGLGWWAYRRLRPTPNFSLAVPQPSLVAVSAKLALPEGTSVLGRATDADLPLPDEPTLSRRHAEIVRKGDLVTIRDLGSKNGTFVNGLAATDSVPLKNGDEVRLGAWSARFVSGEP